MYLTEYAINILKERKKELELEYKDMAQRMGVKDEKNINNYLRGKKTLGKKMILRLIDCLELDENIYLNEKEKWTE